MGNHLFPPLGIAAVNIKRDHAEILLGTRVIERPHRLIEVFVAPTVVPLMSQQVASDPALFGTRFIAIFGECPFPYGPQHA